MSNTFHKIAEKAFNGYFYSSTYTVSDLISKEAELSFWLKFWTPHSPSPGFYFMSPEEQALALLFIGEIFATTPESEWK